MNNGSSDFPDQIPTRHTNQIALHEFFQFRCSPQWLAAGAGVGFGIGVAIWSGLRWKQLRWPLLILGGAGAATAAAYTMMLEPRKPVLERVTLRFPRLPPSLNGLRIGHLSDFHLGFPFARANTRWAVARMMEEKPDLIVITGDVVSFRHAIPLLPEILSGLHAPLGIYAVAGNHDHWEGLDAIRAHLESAGIVFLMNQGVVLSWRGATFWLVGIDDVWYGKPDLDAAMADVPADAFTILLSHAPDVADQAATYPIALQLSGHTHGGHLQFPGLGWFCVPFHGLRYINGVFHIGAMQMYVSRGLGGLPMRLNCRPEATMLTINGLPE